MQKYKKKSARFFVTCAILLIAFISAFFLRTRTKENLPAEKSASFVLELAEVDAALLSHLHMGDRVVDRKNRRILGDIIEIGSSPSTAEIYSETRGTLIEAAVPGKLCVRLKLQATERNGEILTEGKSAVRLGQTYYFRTYDFSGEGRVVALE